MAQYYENQKQNAKSGREAGFVGEHGFGIGPLGRKNIPFSSLSTFTVSYCIFCCFSRSFRCLFVAFFLLFYEITGCIVWFDL